MDRGRLLMRDILDDRANGHVRIVTVHTHESFLRELRQPTNVTRKHVVRPMRRQQAVPRAVFDSHPNRVFWLFCFWIALSIAGGLLAAYAFARLLRGA
jgi:hypothetical protein